MGRLETCRANTSEHPDLMFQEALEEPPDEAGAGGGPTVAAVGMRQP